MKTPFFWQSRGWESTVLMPVAQVYRFGAWLDRQCCVPQRAPLPVISVGNATAGGTGKTPTVLALIPLLQSLGLVPHILTRGYKAQQTLQAHRVDLAVDWRHVGDEALLLARAAPTWAGRDRYASACAAQHAGATVAVCDDAHQHHRIRKDIALLVLDGPAGIGNGRLLPAGPLREPFSEAIRRADAVIRIGEDVHQLTGQLSIPVFAAQLRPVRDADFLRDGKWLAFAGIGRPDKFFSMLREQGVALVDTRAFADHHAYGEAEIVALKDAAMRFGARLITTEKDAVKIPDRLRADIAVVSVSLAFEAPEALADFLRHRLNLSEAS